MSADCFPASGMILVDKPQGVTSHDVVSCMRSLLHTKRVGHAGTLDPMATGLLIVGFGQATRLLNYVLGHDKTYEAVIRLGEATTTDDAEGELLRSDEFSQGLGVDVQAADPVICQAIGQRQSSAIPMLMERLKTVITEHFVGNIEQIPTAYSAIKIQGKRAYELSREGHNVSLQARRVSIHDFSLHAASFTVGKSGRTVLDVKASVSCSSGTYIRALARDIGRVTGLGGHLVSLRRLRIGNMNIADSRVVSLETATKTWSDNNGVLQSRLRAVIPQRYTHTMLYDSIFSMFEMAKVTLPVLSINAQQARDIRFGRVIHVAASQVDEAVNNAEKCIVYTQATVNDGIEELQCERLGQHADVVAVMCILRNLEGDLQNYELKPLAVFP